MRTHWWTEKAKALAEKKGIKIHEAMSELAKKNPEEHARAVAEMRDGAAGPRDGGGR